MARNGNSEDSSGRALLKNLMRELFQTETSAARHGRREAARLPENGGPARALRAVAQHADETLARLPALAQRHGLATSAAGSGAGALFSELRERLFDRLTDSERSYRGTLLGCRHGLDLVRMMQLVADCSGQLELDDFFAAWLSTRNVLVQRVEEEMLWFAQHPEEARKLARPLVPLARRATHASS